MNISKYNNEGYADLTAYEAITNDVTEERRIWKRYWPLVYICSPFAGDTKTNIINARRYCEFAVREGMLPIAPHLLFPQFLDDSVSGDRKVGLRFGMILLDRCEALWVFGDRISQGMAAEIKRAKFRGIPINHYNSECDEVVT